MAGMLARVADQNIAGGGRSLQRTALWAQFPANREINREILRFWPSFTHGVARHTAQFTKF